MGNWLWLSGMILGIAAFVAAGRRLFYWHSVVIPLGDRRRLRLASRRRGNWELVALLSLAVAMSCLVRLVLEVS